MYANVSYFSVRVSLTLAKYNSNNDKHYKKTVGRNSEATLSCSNNCPEKLSLVNANVGLTLNRKYYKYSIRRSSRPAVQTWLLSGTDR